MFVSILLRDSARVYQLARGQKTIGNWLPIVLAISTPEEGGRTKSELFDST